MSTQVPPELPLPKKDIYRVIDGELDPKEYARRLRESKEGIQDALKTIDELRALLGIQEEANA